MRLPSRWPSVIGQVGVLDRQAPLRAAPRRVCRCRGAARASSRTLDKWDKTLELAARPALILRENLGILPVGKIRGTSLEAGDWLEIAVRRG
jgi:hypothetical protein